MRYGGFDPIGSGPRLLVFPHPDDHPALLTKPPVGIAVPQPISLDLSAPEVRVCLWPSAMFGTAVPETTIDEHGEADGTEHDIRLAPQTGYRPPVDAVSQPAPMELRTQLALDPRIAGRLAAHPATDRRRCRRHWRTTFHDANLRTMQ